MHIFELMERNTKKPLNIRKSDRAAVTIIVESIYQKWQVLSLFYGKVGLSAVFL